MKAFSRAVLMMAATAHDERWPQQSPQKIPKSQISSESSIKFGHFHEITLSVVSEITLIIRLARTGWHSTVQR